jgi:hypothetical protein
MGEFTVSRIENSFWKMLHIGTRDADICAAMKHSRDNLVHGRDNSAYGRVIFSGRISSSNSLSVRYPSFSVASRKLILSW